MRHCACGIYMTGLYVSRTIDLRFDARIRSPTRELSPNYRADNKPHGKFADAVNQSASHALCTKLFALRTYKFQIIMTNYELLLKQPKYRRQHPLCRCANPRLSQLVQRSSQNCKAPIFHRMIININENRNTPNSL